MGHLPPQPWRLGRHSAGTFHPCQLLARHLEYDSTRHIGRVNDCRRYNSILDGDGRCYNSLRCAGLALRKKCLSRWCEWTGVRLFWRDFGDRILQTHDPIDRHRRCNDHAVWRDTVGRFADKELYFIRGASIWLDRRNRYRLARPENREARCLASRTGSPAKIPVQLYPPELVALAPNPPRETVRVRAADWLTVDLATCVLPPLATEPIELPAPV